MRFKISVPATSANIGPGFDVWGMALSLRNRFNFETTSHTNGTNYCNISFNYDDTVKTVALRDPEKALPNNDRNLIAKSYLYLFRRAELQPKPIQIQADIHIPLARGLGSSSTATLAGMVAANEVMRHYYNKAYPIEKVFEFATRLEGHPDNIAPALWGGWILTLYDTAQQLYIPFPLEINAPLRLAGVVPHDTLSTQKAREVLPSKVDLSTVSFQSSRTALLPYLMAKSEWGKREREAFSLALQDRVHQRQRAKFIPGMVETFSYWRELGALGAFLSGAGTTLLGFWEKEADLSKLDLTKRLRDHNKHATSMELEFDQIGLTLEAE